MTHPRLTPIVWAGAGVLLLVVLYLGLLLLLARRELAAARRGLAEISWSRLTYASSVDGTAPLHALVVGPSGGGALRMLVMIHGYTESAADTFSAACRFARQGYLVLLPDMRGRTSRLRYPRELLGGRQPLGIHLPGWRTVVRLATPLLAEDDLVSAGRPDSGGIEVLDIRDAMETARTRYAARLDPDAPVTIVGYSGGGTSALLAAIRMPRLFQRVVAFFPIVDFAAQEAHLARLGRGPLAQLRAWIGGRPDEVPYRYAARRLLAGLSNLRREQVFVLVDTADELCPVSQARRMSEGVELRISGPGDPVRWHHETPDEDSPLHAASPLISGASLAKVDGGSFGARLVVLGYLVTPEFEVFLGDGQEGLIRCRARHEGDRVVFELWPVEVPEGLRVRIRLRHDGRWLERRDLPPRGEVTIQLPH